MKLADLETVIVGEILDAMEDTRPLEREHIAEQHATLAARELRHAANSTSGEEREDYLRRTDNCYQQVNNILKTGRPNG